MMQPQCTLFLYLFSKTIGQVEHIFHFFFVLFYSVVAIDTIRSHCRISKMQFDYWNCHVMYLRQKQSVSLMNEFGYYRGAVVSTFIYLKKEMILHGEYVKSDYYKPFAFNLITDYCISWTRLALIKFWIYLHH